MAGGGHVNLFWPIWHKQKSTVRFLGKCFFLNKGTDVVGAMLSSSPSSTSLCLKCESDVWYCSGHIVTMGLSYEAKGDGTEDRRGQGL